MYAAIVTGANGFVGSAVIKYLLKKGIRVLALCHNGERSRLLDIEDSIKIGSFNLDNIEKILDSIPVGEYDTFYHFAWEGSGGKLRADEKIQLKNVENTVSALRIAHKLGCRRFVCAGSIMEHEVVALMKEGDRKPGMGYIYAAGKLAAHLICMSVAANLGIELLWAEITNAYGAGEISPRMINTAIRKCLNKETLEFTEGFQNYDFVYIDDVARAFYLIGENGKPFKSYLIGSGHARPLRDFLVEMQKAIAPDSEFLFGAIPFTGVQLDILKFDCSVTEKDTGFKSRISFTEGIKLTKKWLEEIE